MKGEDDEGRNGRVRCKFGASMRFAMKDNKIPILTSKRLAWKTCLKELLWFISGNTSNKTLKAMNVHLWDGNSSREFLDSRGLEHLHEDDLGPIYGFQWRFFNAQYSSCNEDYNGKGVDQLQEVIDCLKDPERRTSRRLVVTALNPCQVNKMALPPCHVMFQFNVVDGNKLSCSLMARSQDVFLGEPFNIASYSLLVCIFSEILNLVPGEFIWTGGDCHIYNNHFEQVKKQIKRKPMKAPKLKIPKLKSIDDVLKSKPKEYVLVDYNPMESIKAPMAV